MLYQIICIPLLSSKSFKLQVLSSRLKLVISCEVFQYRCAWRLPSPLLWEFQEIFHQDVIPIDTNVICMGKIMPLIKFQSIIVASLGLKLRHVYE
jgi:hypothetical protein